MIAYWVTEPVRWKTQTPRANSVRTEPVSDANWPAHTVTQVTIPLRSPIVSLIPRRSPLPRPRPAPVAGRGPPPRA